MIEKNLSTLKIHKLTQVQYERELAAGRIDENALYLTPDDENYYTDAEIDTLLADKSDTTHTHTVSEISDLAENLLDLTYPIGAIYLSVNSTSPASLFGGT